MPIPDIEINKLPSPGIVLIKEFEGCYTKAYPDPRTGYKPITIGYGSTEKLDGSEWVLGDVITEEYAEKLLITQLTNNYLPSLQKIPVWSKLNINQQGALLSFGYNVGANFYNAKHFKTISNVLASQDFTTIDKVFVIYRNPGSNVEAGLLRRRKAEAKLFMSPVID